jgi:diguanylate cyclase (GGDEF)-like protein/PAS domain S-box-containing protein
MADRRYDHGSAGNPRVNFRRAPEARILVSLAGLIAAALLMVAAAVYLGSVQQDKLQEANERRAVALSVSTLKRSLVTNVRDYAWWNEAVRALVLAVDEAWADINIGPYVYHSFAYEVVLVVWPDDRPVLGWLRDSRATSAAAAALGNQLPLLVAAVRRSQAGPEPVAIGTVLPGEEGLLIAAASPIVPQQGSDLKLPSGPPAILVFAKLLDQDFLARLADDLGVEGPSYAAPSTATSDEFTRIQLEGPTGEAVGAIAWRPWHPGLSQLKWLIPALLGSLAVFWLFTRIVLRSIRRATAAIRRSEARFRDIAEASSDWIWETDRDLNLTYVSEHFGRATGLIPSDVLGRPLHRVLQRRDATEAQERNGGIGVAASFRDILCLLHTDGRETRTLRVAGKPVLDPKRNLIGYRGTATDITAEVEAQRQLQFFARHDPLTGLPNRMVLLSRLEETLVRGRRDHQTAAMLCLDLDRFKAVNDGFGHAAGDEVLVGCAERLRGCIRDTDLVARLGGDEFAVLQVGVTRIEDVHALCERILAVMAQPFRLDGTEAVVGASVGVAMIPADGDQAARILQKADIALYRAKAEGRNRARFFEAWMDERQRRRRDLETALRHALTAGQLEIHYQPQVSIESTALIGVEALLRWRHPDRGPIAPAEFIPVAEETGLIVPIGDWVLRAACRVAARWPQLTVSVNVSPTQFRERDLVWSVEKALAAAHLPPERLEIEITEGVLIQNTAEALRTLTQLKQVGIKIAMDDFGTGYSSLSYLQKFPFDKIKIDRSFVASLCEENSSIIRAIVNLGHSLGMHTCAEGVETKEQLWLLRREGCEQAQGYLFGAAMDADMVDLLMPAAIAGPRSPRLRAVG